jgi:hypothetical protein
MTKVLITIDTELSAGRQAQGWTVADNFAASITGRCAAGDFGTGWQMDVMDAHGVKGVFFVDPMPAAVHGVGVIADLVGPIVARGHEVQLHAHAEWLEWAAKPIAKGPLARNIGDFSLDDQIAILGAARDWLIAAGAPSPIAFRAGNYGANDDTLRALAALGIAWDSSLNPSYRHDGCAIAAQGPCIAPFRYQGVAELPVATFHDRGAHVRHVQVCAASTGETRAALCHAAANSVDAVAVVSHSFEMLSRDRLRPNRAVMRRFEALCGLIAGDPSLESSGFADLTEPAAEASSRAPQPLAPNTLRTAWRMGEQLWANWRYERAGRAV